MHAFEKKIVGGGNAFCLLIMYIHHLLYYLLLVCKKYELHVRIICKHIYLYLA